MTFFLVKQLKINVWSLDNFLFNKLKNNNIDKVKRKNCIFLILRKCISLENKIVSL